MKVVVRGRTDPDDPSLARTGGGDQEHRRRLQPHPADANGESALQQGTGKAARASRDPRIAPRRTRTEGHEVVDGAIRS